MRYATILLAAAWIAAGPAAAADRLARTVVPPPLRLDADALSRADLRVHWRLPLPLRRTEQIEQVWLLDEHLYALSSRGMLFAIRADSGLVRWQTSVAQPGDFVFPLTHAASDNGRGAVVVTGPSTVLLLDRATGDRDGQVRLSVPAAASAVADSSHVFVTLCNQQFAMCRRSDGAEVWRMASDRSTAIAPQWAPDRVLFVGGGGLLLCRQADARKKVWTEAMDCAPIAPVYFDGKDLIFVADDRRVYSIDGESGPVEGKAQWRRRLNGVPAEGPVVLDDLVFQHSPGEGLLAMDRASGAPRWCSEAGRRFLARDDAAAYLMTADDDRLLVVDAADGRTRHAIGASGVRFAPANVGSDAVLLVSRAGEVVCVRRRDAGPIQIKIKVQEPVVAEPPSPPSEG